MDYPGKIAAVVFCGGCNFNCWYCHNRHILHGYDAIDEREVFSFLEKRKGQIDAVVFSGGEATLQKDLAEQMRRVKDMGYLVKLDTNGANPKVLSALIGAGLPDYVAMDIKAPFARYKETTGVAADIAAVQKSVSILTGGQTEYEFRTTCVPQFAPEDIESIAKEIAGARLYALQQYRHTDTEHKISPIRLAPHERAFFDESRRLARKHIENVVIRGI
ncbi:anaerobic ribonucleoside-triphosphate reductase activating protein [Clostridia bacterium]|nr:anaerobic ribonucleoside-triphosphate reductase activating protein [Clostridia bacterium]